MKTLESGKAWGKKQCLFFNNGFCINLMSKVKKSMLILAF